MINLVTIKDFSKQPYQIVLGSRPDSVLENQIEKYQKEILILILGNQEYYNLINDNSGLFPTSQKWIDFINGVSYVKNGKNINYEGVKEVIIAYVYYWYKRNNDLQTGITGGLKLDLRNAKNILEGQTMVDAFNEVVKDIGFISNDKPTVFNYLNDHDFDAEMTLIEKINNIL